MCSCLQWLVTVLLYSDPALHTSIFTELSIRDIRVTNFSQFLLHQVLLILSSCLFQFWKLISSLSLCFCPCQQQQQPRPASVPITQGSRHGKQESICLSQAPFIMYVMIFINMFQRKFLELGLYVMTSFGNSHIYLFL